MLPYFSELLMTVEIINELFILKDAISIVTTKKLLNYKKNYAI